MVVTIGSEFAAIRELAAKIPSRENSDFQKYSIKTGASDAYAVVRSIRGSHFELLGLQFEDEAESLARDGVEVLVLEDQQDAKEVGAHSEDGITIDFKLLRG